MNSQREISVPEVARRLGCYIPHVQNLIRTDRIPGCKTERGWVTTVAAAEAHVEDRRAARGRTLSAK